MAMTQKIVIFLEIVALLLGISGCILLKIDIIQPDAYMDEIFHIPQAQKYCYWNFNDWDPMITTLPGLYMLSVTVLQPISSILNIPMEKLCTSFGLRSINIAFAVGNLGLLCLLLWKLQDKHKDKDIMKCMITASALSLVPVLYFFTFLYYTDPGSVFFVLLTYLCSIYDRHKFAALAGVISVLFRQTNIVWVAFCAMVIISKHLTKHVKQQLKPKDKTAGFEQHLQFVYILFKNIFLHTKLLDIVKLAGAIFNEIWTYVLVGIAFVAFVVLNGGIVVGAKDDHQAGLHFTQLFYFSAFCGVFSIAVYISIEKLKGFLKFLLQKPFLFVFISLAMYFLIWKYTYTHKYLLADNRHYTFYVWSKIFKRHENMKYFLIPGYIFAYWNMFHSLQHQSVLWKISYFICIVINLVPSMLLEFRYFIIPYLMLRLHSPMPSYLRLGFEILYNVLINAVTIYMFMQKPFHWDTSNAVQRFMW